MAISVLAMFVNYAISFVLTPYITINMGADAFGFVSLAKTIANYGIVITGCLNAFASRFITLSYHKGDINKANQYFSSVVLANLGLLIVVLLFEILFIWKLQLFFKIPTELIRDVKTLFALDITNYMLLALANSFVASAYVKNRLDLIEVFKLIAYLIEAGVLLVLFNYLPTRIYYVGIGLVASTLILGICNSRLSKKETPDLMVSKNNFSWKAVKDLVFSGIWNSINSIGNMLNSGLDLWVSNIMLSAISMGELSIVKTVATILSSLEQLISRPFHPYLLKRYSQNDINGVVSIFKSEIKISGYISAMICSGLLCFGTIYYILWTPSENTELLYGITAVTAIGFLFEGIVQPLFYTYTLTLKNKVPCIITIISGLINVIGMYILLKTTELELYAVVGTTTVLGFLTFFIFTPIYSCKCLKIKWSTYYSIIIRVILATAAITFVLFLIFHEQLPDTWIGLILDIVVSCFIGLPIFGLFVFDRKDYRIINNKIKSILNI